MKLYENIKVNRMTSHFNQMIAIDHQIAKIITLKMFKQTI